MKGKLIRPNIGIICYVRQKWKSIVSLLIAVIPYEKYSLKL